MLPRTVRRPRLTVALSALAAAALCAVVAAPPASAQAPVHYVALGDSYASGVGAGDYIGASGSCDRSTNAFSQLWANASHPASYVSVACSGATTGSVISSQLSALSNSTTLVSIVIGGNDVGFVSTIEACVLQSTSSCVRAIQAGESKIANQLPGELDTVLSSIARDAPHARVVVLDYPQFYDLAESGECIGLSTTDRTSLNQAAAQLDNAIQAAAARHGDVFANVQPDFAGHQICDSGSWLHSLDFFDIAASYHPTADGQANAYYPAFRSAVSG